MIPVKRIILSAAAGRLSTAVAEIRFRFEEIKGVLTHHSEEFKRLLSWSIQGDEIVFKARPEAFGVARILDTIIEVSPKFLPIEEKIPISFVSDLFNVTNAPLLSSLPPSEISLEGAPNSLFDWYFYSTLNQINDFLKKYDRVVLHTYEETIVGVRGRLKVADSIRRGKGLKHINVCELQTTQPRYEFLGTIKGLVNVLKNFSENTLIQETVSKCLGHLKNVEALPFDKASIKKLKTQSKLLISEHRKSATILNSIFGMFELIEMGVGSITHHCFSFNMNAQFELLVTRLVKSYAVSNSYTLKSGNTKPLNLLNNLCSGLEIDDGDNEFEADSITIKPDIYIENSVGSVVSTLDAKYKVLTYEPTKEKFSGVESKDVQQVLAYWLHFQNMQKKPMNVGLVYPLPAIEKNTKILLKIGEILMDDPVNNKKLKIDIFAVDILLAVRVLASGANVNDLEFNSILAA